MENKEENMRPDEIFSGFNVSLDQGIAENLSVSAALIYNHILYWLKINANKPETKMIDGKYWMYETNKQMAEFFKFLSEEEISKGIKKLKEAGLIEVRKLSKNPFDHTSWYTIYDQSKIKKGLRNPAFGGIDIPVLADSEYPLLAESTYITTEKKTDNKQQQQAVAVAEKKSEVREDDIQYENSKGEKLSISQSEVFKHFIKLPYSTDIIKKAISSMQSTTKIVNNPIKLLESICKTMHENSKPDIKPTEKKEVKKIAIKDANHITWAEYEKQQKLKAERDKNV